MSKEWVLCELWRCELVRLIRRETGQGKAARSRVLAEKALRRQWRQEIIGIPLFGLGVANICGSFFSAYPITGSFSRSAVNHESGAKTGLSGITMGIIMGCALLFMTPLFSEIPQCALAAIVISAVMGLVDYEVALFLWHIDKKDFLLWMITCIATLIFGIEIGVVIGNRPGLPPIWLDAP